MQEPTPPKIEFNLLVLFVFFAFIFAWIRFQAQKKKKQLTKKYKQELYAPYAVDKKTFSKWVETFCADIIPIEEYKAKRKLSQWTMERIQERLGSPDRVGAMNRKQIAGVAGSKYETIREAVFPNLEGWGLTLEQYDSMGTFPPFLVEKIAVALGDPEEFFRKSKE